MEATSLVPATGSFSRSTIADDDGIKTSIATVVTVQTYSGAALNGAEMASTSLGKSAVARTLSVTTSAQAGTYNVVDPIIISGTYKGEPVSESLALTLTDGDQTIRGTQPFDLNSSLSIAVPAQADALGTFKFGVEGIVPNGAASAFRRVKPLADGNLFVQYSDNSKDLIPVKNNQVERILASRVLTTDGTNTTTVGVTVYL